MDTDNEDKTSRVFDLAKRLAKDHGAPLDFIDIAEVKDPRYTKTVHTKKGPKKRTIHDRRISVVAQWETPGLSEDQMEKIEDVIEQIKKPHSIRSRVNEKGRYIPPARHLNADGTPSMTRRGYFVGRQNWNGKQGVWVTRRFSNGNEARREMRRPGWLYGDGAHMIELVEDCEMRQLALIEYVSQVSRILGGNEPLPRDQAVYTAYRELATLDMEPISQEDVVGVNDKIEEIKFLLSASALNPEAARHYDVESQSPLVAGVPGVGKTEIARLLLSQDMRYLFIPISATSLVQHKSDEHGEDEGLFSELEFIQSQTGALACLYCDDVEAAMLDPTYTGLSEHYLARSSTLLNRLQGIQMNSKIKISGATNDPTIIDRRFLEFGRIGYVIHIPLPGDDARYQTFEVHTRNRPTRDLKFDEIIRRTDGYTNRDIAEMCNSAARYALRRAAESVRQDGDDIFAAIKNVDTGVMEDHPITMKDFERAFGYVSTQVDTNYNRTLDRRIGEFCSGYKRTIGFDSR